jgi:hypothetical protein
MRAQPAPAPHPLDHHPSFRALIAAAPPVAELATRIAHRGIISALAIACSDLADGFASPPDSRRRVQAHQRAWILIREIDRVVADAGRSRRAPSEIVSRAQRAVDRADVLIGALLPS